MTPSKARQGDDTGEAEAPVRARRVRRSREAVVALIEDAARELFAERGYNAATTREIAQRAQVSETLLFRYFDDKARLFEQTVAAPFDRLMAGFLERNSDPAEAERMFGQVFALLEGEREILAAMIAGSIERNGGVNRGVFQSFLTRAVAGQRAQIERSGGHVDFDIDTGVRLAFGMMISAALLQEWLFPAGAPPKDRLVDTIRAMVERAFEPLHD